MALTSAQIVTLALQEAGCPNFTLQAGQKLNLILQGLCQDYDFDLARTSTTVPLNPGLVTNYGSGPYSLPADYLRAYSFDDLEVKRTSVWFLYRGIPRYLIPVDIGQFDEQLQLIGQQTLPYLFASDMSASPPSFYVFPPPDQAYVLNIRYQRQIPDISSPEISTTVPWFPSQEFLLRRLAGEMFAFAGDMEKAGLYLGGRDERSGFLGAAALLAKYLPLKDDRANRAACVTLDPRFFRTGGKNLPNTKSFPIG